MPVSLQRKKLKNLKKTDRLHFDDDGAGGDGIMCESDNNTFNDCNLSNLQKEALVQLQYYLHHQAIFPLNDYLEITESQFYFLAEKLNPLFVTALASESCKEYTVEIQLAITLKYLTTNEFCLPNNLGMLTLQKVMLAMTYQMCEWMYKALKDEYLALPNNSNDWQILANRFNYLYNMPFCLGVLSMLRLGSTQVPIRFSRKCSPLIFTSILDADSNFIYADVIRSRTIEWDGFYEVSDIKKIIENKKVHFPQGLYGNQPNIGNLRFFVSDNSMPNTRYLLSELHTPGPRWNGNNFIYTQCPPKSLEFNFCQTSARINARSQQTLHALQTIFPAVSQLWCLENNKARKVLLGSILLYNYLRATSTTNRANINTIANAAPANLANMIGLDAPKTFNRLLKQKGDTDAGLTTRNRVIIYMAIRRLNVPQQRQLFDANIPPTTTTALMPTTTLLTKYDYEYEYEYGY